MDTESIQKTLKISNFTTTNAIMIKRTIDIYPNKVFHLAKSWIVSQRVHKGVKKKNTQNKPENHLLDQFRPLINTSKN